MHKLGVSMDDYDELEGVTSHKDVIDLAARLGQPLDTAASPSRGDTQRACVTLVNTQRMFTLGPYVPPPDADDDVMCLAYDANVLQMASQRVRISAIEHSAGTGKFAKGHAIESVEG